MIDPVTLAVLKGRLEQIADEMDATLFRTAFNPIIAEAHDASHGLYDAQTGETLIQGKSGLPIFVGAMSFAVGAVIEKVKKDGDLREGDVFLFNDPYKGATHLNDVKLVQPLFRNGSVFCYIASVGHWHDVGGNVPGNYNPQARESFQEGVRIPPVKIIREGVFQQDILDIILANTRLPRSCYGDLHAQLNSLSLGHSRLNEVLDEYGDDAVHSALELLKKRADRLMREQISELPNGCYSAEDFLDNDGHQDKPLRIALAMTISDDTMKLDFTGTAAPCEGPLNIARSTTISGCYVALKHIFKDVPANSGCLQPIEFVIPEDSLLSVEAPKPVGGYTETVLRVIDLIFVAISKAAPKRSNGGAYGTINALSLAGFRENGERWVMFSFFGGGLGGNPEGDGLNHGNAPISTATIPPVEILEAAYPVLFNRWSLRPDSGGAGQHRGGLGAVYEIELLEQEAEVFFFGERARYAPPGITGGAAASKTHFSYQQDDGMKVPPLASKLVGKQLRRGQHLRIESPGGGGYGHPQKRSLDSIERDYRLGYITRDGAKRDYGVLIDDEGCAHRLEEEA